MNHDPSPDLSAHKVTGDQPHVFEGWARFFPLSVRRANDGTWEVTAHWPRLALGAIVALALAWATLMGGAWLFLRYERDFTAVSYPRMLLLFMPSHWQAFEVARGDALIKEAQDKLAAGKARDSYYDLQIGVPKSPANLQGRLLLAKFWTDISERSATSKLVLLAQAKQLLLDGLAYHSDNPDYVQQVFGFLLQQQQDQAVIDTAEQMLAKGHGVDRLRQRIAWAEATAHFNRGRYDQAENLIDTYDLRNFKEGRLLSAGIEWDRGERETAIAHLREISALPQYAQDDDVYSQLVRYLRATGREAEAKNESYLRSVANPRDPLPRIDLLRSAKLAGDESGVRTGFDSIMHDFSTSNQVLLALADFAAENGDVVEAREIWVHCRDDTSGLLHPEYPALMVAEAMVVAKDYRGALDFMQRLEAANPGWTVQFATIFAGLKAVATFGLGEESDARNHLADYLAKPNVQAANLVAVSKRLVDVGQRNQARLVLAQAVKSDPLDQAALTSLVQLDVDYGNAEELGDTLHRLIQMRKPNRTVLEAAYARLGSDRFLFSPNRSAMLAEVRTALDSPAVPRAN
jgi:hypothetical protein